MYYGVDTFWKILSSWTFRFGLLSIILLAVAFYFVLGKEANSSVTGQLLSKQQVITRAEVSNITIFFERIGDAVATLAQTKSVESRNENAAYNLDTFMDQRQETGLVGGVILTDKDGVVKLNSNISGNRDIGQSVADRDFFIWAKSRGKRGEYYINKPVISKLGATKGKTIIAVASPVYQNDKFSGVVSASVQLEPLVERFFGLMRVSDQTEVYLFDGQGNLLYSNFAPEAEGSNIAELFSDDLSLNSKISSVLSTEEEGKIETKTSLVTYSPVTLGEQKWLLVLSSPRKEVDDLTSPIYIRQIAIFALASLTFLIFGIIAVRENKA